MKGAESDAVFGRAIGRSSTVVGDYRRAEQTPNSGILSEAAERMGVDYRWLTGKLPSPPQDWPDRELFDQLFDRWLSTSREGLTVPVMQNPAALTRDAAPQQRPRTK